MSVCFFLGHRYPRPVGSINSFKGVQNGVRNSTPSLLTFLKSTKNCLRTVTFAEYPESSLVPGISYASTYTRPVQRFLLKPYLVVPKPKRSIHPILGLKSFSKYLQNPKFHRESTKAVVAFLRQGEYLASVDIHDAYLYISIYPPHQRFLYSRRQSFFRLVALSFGLFSVPRVFTKVLAHLVCPSQN